MAAAPRPHFPSPPLFSPPIRHLRTSSIHLPQPLEKPGFLFFCSFRFPSACVTWFQSEPSFRCFQNLGPGTGLRAPCKPPPWPSPGWLQGPLTLPLWALGAFVQVPKPTVFLVSSPMESLSLPGSWLCLAQSSSSDGPFLWEVLLDSRRLGPSWSSYPNTITTKRPAVSQELDVFLPPWTESSGGRGRICVSLWPSAVSAAPPW